MSETIEQLKIIPGYKGRYDISRDGKVYSLNYGRRTELKQSEHKGYRRVALSHENKRQIYPVHVLVARAFLENPLNKPFVNHRDGNKRNNHALNLEWCTRQENQQHSREVLGNTGRGNKNANYGYRKSKFYPGEELRNRLIELGVPRYKHDIVQLGEMLPHKLGDEHLLIIWKNAAWNVTYEDVEGGKIRVEIANTEANARAKMLIYLIENNLITIKSLEANEYDVRKK